MAFVAVKGEVTRTFWDGRGVAVKETFQRQDGSEGAAYFTAWFEEDQGLSEGVYGEFSGLLGVKLDRYEKDGEEKVTYDVSINNTKFKPAEGGGSSQSSNAPRGQTEWGKPAVSDEEPF